MNACPVCGQLHAPNCLRVALEDLRARPVFKPPEPHCFCCGYPRADGIQTHALDCEWCTLVQRVAQIEKHLSLKESNGISEAIPDTQRSGERGHTGIHDAAGWSDRCGQCLAEAIDPGEPHADAGAAEPGREAPAGTVPAYAGSEWPSRPGQGSQ